MICDEMWFVGNIFVSSKSNEAPIFIFFFIFNGKRFTI